jgi:thiol-disulfide isomerase/thioredoxin
MNVLKPELLVAVTLALVLSCLPASALHAQQNFSLPVGDDTEVDIVRYAADGDYLLLWLAPEYGFREAHRQLARRLPDEGIEVWQTSLAEALFMPNGATTMRQLDGSLVADLIAGAHATSGKRILLAGDSYATLPVLAGAHQWQQRHDADYLLGAVLFTPYAYASIPPLGQEPEYMPIVDATNIPLLVFQAQNSATRHRFDELLERLRRHGSPVYTRMIPDLMSLFYEEPPSAAMHDGSAPIPRSLRQLLPLLEQHSVPRDPVPMRSAAATDGGIDIYLREFTADLRPLPLDLDDIDGRRVVKTDFTGQVTMINFWASWCGPCVEEIPSLNRLQQKMAGKPFELISINFAEDRQTVAAFMERVRVDFPVLLDIDGKQADAWRVVTYPSTFVIDSRGRIRYGVNAAIDWDDPSMLEKLEALMD